MARRRRSRSRRPQPRRSAAPFSVTMTPASLRGTETGPDSRSTMRALGSTTIETPPGDCVRRAHEIERAADRADVAAAGELAVDLAGQVDLDRRVDRDEARLPREDSGVVRVLGAAQAHARRCRARSRTASCEPISSAQSMRLTIRRSASSTTPSPTLPECTRRPSWRPRARAHGVGQGADAELQHRAVRDEVQRRGARSRLQLARWPRSQASRAAASSRTTRSKSSFASSALGVRPRHLVVHLGDDRAAGVERRAPGSRRRARGCTRRARWAGSPGPSRRRHGCSASRISDPSCE